MLRERKPRRGRSLYSIIVLSVLMVMCVSGMIISGGYLVLFSMFPMPFLGMQAMTLLAIFATVLCAVSLYAAAGRKLLKPVNDLIRATKSVARGDFKVRVEENSQPGIQELIESFNSMTEELGSVELFRNDFISNISHEFKTPIASIRGFANQLTREDLSQQERIEYARIIVQESERLTKMTETILLITRLENGDKPLAEMNYRLDEQIRRCVLLLEKAWTAKNIELTLELPNTELYANEEMMNHVWINLLDNAIKFSPEGGEVSARLQVEGEEIHVYIADQGIGMTEDVQKHIFDKFYQGDGSHATSGNGLGLPLAKRIVSVSGGDISVKSAIGQGSTFMVTLPARGVETEQREQA